MIKNFTTILFILVLTHIYASIDSTMVLTPGYENITLAKINGKEIKEFDVFGAPGISKSRNKMSESKRTGKIQDYVLDIIFQTEGNTPEIINSEDYKKTYKLILKKIAVDRYREAITEENFLNKEEIAEYYELNKEKYPLGMKELPDIKNDIKKDKRKEINLYIMDVLDSLVKLNKVAYNDELFKAISDIQISDPFKFADSLLLIGPDIVLVSYNHQKVTLRDLAVVVKGLKPYHMSNLKNVKILKSLVDGNILNELLANVAESKGYFKDEEVNRVTVENMKYFVSSEYKKRLFSPDNLKPTKDELIDYYIAHKDDTELKTIKKMWTYEIFKTYDNNDEVESNDKIKVAIELENIREKILAGESFEKYAKFYARPNTRDGELGYIYKTDHAMIGETAYEMKAGEVSDLIIQEKAISIIKVTEIKEPQLYKFDYVEEIIKNRVTDYKRDKLKSDLKMKLFKKYKVELSNAQ